jgi:polyphosphate kinase
MKRLALDDPRYYFNRHVQWLEFNRRVLEEARDVGNPLPERVLRAVHAGTGSTGAQQPHPGS